MELKIEDRFNSITATNSGKTITFCGIEVKSIMLMFSPWDDSDSLVGQSFSFKDKDEHDSFVDFLKIACKYSVKMYDFNLANESIRESEFFGYMGTNRFFFNFFDGYNLDGKKYFVHSLTVYKN